MWYVLSRTFPLLQAEQAISLLQKIYMVSSSITSQYVINEAPYLIDSSNKAKLETNERLVQKNHPTRRLVFSMSVSTASYAHVTFLKPFKSRQLFVLTQLLISTYRCLNALLLFPLKGCIFSRALLQEKPYQALYIFIYPQFCFYELNEASCLNIH